MKPDLHHGQDSLGMERNTLRTLDQPRSPGKEHQTPEYALLMRFVPSWLI